MEKIEITNPKFFYLGSIAPDCAKIVGINRNVTHYIKDNEKGDYPRINRFLNKYSNVLDKNHPFELGVYVHLLTDNIWFKEFIHNYTSKVTDLDGNVHKINNEEFCKILYNDYSNLNKKIIDDYNMDLSLFYEEFDYPESNIAEIKEIYFDEIIKKMSNYVLVSKKHSYLLDEENIYIFIEYTADYCVQKIKELYQ